MWLANPERAAGAQQRAMWIPVMSSCVGAAVISLIPPLFLWSLPTGESHLPSSSLLSPFSAAEVWAPYWPTPLYQGPGLLWDRDRAGQVRRCWPLWLCPSPWHVPPPTGCPDPYSRYWLPFICFLFLIENLPKQLSAHLEWSIIHTHVVFRSWKTPRA